MNKADKDKYMTASIESMLSSNKKMENLMKEIVKPMELKRTPKRRISMQISTNTQNRTKGRER